ncbi:fibroblast growth factor-binding protein 1-like [Arapaima gigas]
MRPSYATYHKANLEDSSEPVLGAAELVRRNRMILKNLAAFLVLTCIAQQVLLVDCEKGPAKKGKTKGEGKGKGGRNKGAPLEKSPAVSPGGNKPQKVEDGKLVLKGKHTYDEGLRCNWSAHSQDTVTLKITCKKGKHKLKCQFMSRPSICLQYLSNEKGYYKQINHALKHKKSPCEETLISSDMCEEAGNDAHFKRRPGKSSRPHKPAGTIPPEQEPCVSHKKQAEEVCSESLISACTWLFSLIQAKDC